MEKYNSIREYAEKTGVTVDDMKDMILRTALDFGCDVAYVEDDKLQDVENMFSTLWRFNDLLDSVV